MMLEFGGELGGGLAPGTIKGGEADAMVSINSNLCQILISVK